MRKYPVFVALLLFVFVCGAGAQTSEPYEEYSTPGTVSTLDGPSAWEAHYNSGSDVVVLFEPGRNQVMIFPYADKPPASAVRDLLADVEGSRYAPDVKMTRLGGRETASIRVEAESGGVRDWIVAFRKDGLLLMVWAKTGQEYTEVEPVVERVIRSVTPADARHPDKAIGSYRTGPEQESDSEKTSGSGRSTVRMEEGGDLLFAESPGTWEIRGNRLLFQTENDYYNYRFSFNEKGIVLYDNRNNALQWEQRE